MNEYNLVNMNYVCNLYSVTERTIRRWIAEDCFPEPFKIGGSLRWQKSVVDKWATGVVSTAYVTLPTSSGSIALRVVPAELRVEHSTGVFLAAFRNSSGNWVLRPWATQAVLDADEEPILLACEDAGVETLSISEFSKGSAA